MNRKILAIGGGGIGERHIRVLTGMEQIELSVCDINTELLNRLESAYNISDTYSSLDDVDLERFDIVVISAPAHLHVSMITQALQANCHVLCEKPLALSLDGIDRIIELSQKKAKTVGVAYIYRSMPAMDLLRQRIVSGEIGDVKSLTFVLGADFSYFRPDYKNIYYADHETGGGALHDAVSHMINYIQWCMGPIESIYCLARHLVLPGVDVEDTVGSVISFSESDAIGTLSLNQFQPANGMMLEFAGTEGILKFDGTTHSIGLCKEPCGDFTWSEKMSMGRDEYHKLQFENFFTAVDNRKPFVCTLEDAEMTMKTILAAHESVKQNMPISILDDAYIS